MAARTALTSAGTLVGGFCKDVSLTGIWPWWNRDLNSANFKPCAVLITTTRDEAGMDSALTSLLVAAKATPVCGSLKKPKRSTSAAA